MKFKSPFYKRIISAVLALTLAIGCGFGTAMAADPAAVTAAQSVALADWNARTYDVTLTASSNMIKTPDPVDVVLVLDKSGSMPWMLTQPTGNGGNPVKGKLDIKNTDSTQRGYNYTYYIYWQSEQEYQPIGYIDDSIYGKGYFEGNDEKNYYKKNSGWYRIVSASNGKKQIKELITTSNAVDYRNPIYLRGSTDQTKFEKMKEATAAFIDNMQTFSQDNKIAVVGFSTGEQHQNFLPLDNTNKATLNNFISGLMITGGTNFADGLNEAKSIIDSSNDGRQKYVIVFSDGMSSNTNDAIQAVGTDKKSGIASEIRKNAKIFTVGLYGGSVTGQTRTDAEKFMHDMSSEVDDSANKYCYTSSDLAGMQASFNDIFKKISQSVTATVTTTIDPRFQLLKEDGSTVAQSGDTLYSGGKVTTTNASGVTQWSIQWPNTAVAPQNGATPGWKRVLHLKAKTEFIGGNNLAAATTEMSSVAAGVTKLVFPGSTQVNVKPIFYLGNAATTIFLGQSVPTNTPLQPYTLNDSNQRVTGQGMYIVSTGTTGTFAYQWSGNGANAATQAFPAGIYPKSDTSYKLTATFSSSASWVTMKTTGGAPYSEPAGGNKAINVDNNTNNYTVHVKSGSVTITKNLSDKDGKAITDPGRSFVFLVTGNEEAGDTDIKPFYVTITMGAGSTASKTVTGLSRGTYTVKEVGSNWQYQNGTVQMNRPSGQIGYAKNGAGTDYTDKDLTASVTNKLISNQWFNATDSVTNLVG